MQGGKIVLGAETLWSGAGPFGHYGAVFCGPFKVIAHFGQDVPHVCARYDRHIIPGFFKRGYPVVSRHITGPSVIGGQRQRHRTKPIKLFAQIPRTARNVLPRIKGVHPKTSCGSGHELHQAQCACGADSILVSAAFLMHHAKQELWINALFHRHINGVKSVELHDILAHRGQRVIADHSAFCKAKNSLMHILLTLH